MASGKKTDQQRIAAAERRVKALDYRKAGASYRAIARELGVSEAQAHNDVQRSLADLAAQQQASAEELRALELARLDDLALAATRILQASHPLISGGKVLSGFTTDGKAIGLTDDGPRLQAIDRLLRISERRARLLGLDMQPGALLPGDVTIMLRWNDGRNIIDVTPPTAGDHAAALASLAEPDSAAPGALPYRVLWSEMGQEPISGDAEPQDEP